MNIPASYSAKEVEEKWYDYWLEHDFFRSTPDQRTPYTIVIPPPNVTGVLHMGHMLNNTIQDVLIRKARLQGKNACWVPGTDHASIATEVVLFLLVPSCAWTPNPINPTTTNKAIFFIIYLNFIRLKILNF